MNQELKHARVVTRTPRPGEPDTVDIDKKSYYDELNAVEEQIEKSIKTSKASLAADVIGCLREIAAGETVELTLRIVTNKATREPERIVKTWTTKKEYYGR